jgi:hypothetical protein
MFFIYVSEFQEEAPMKNKQALEERKGNIYRYTYIDLHDILKKNEGKINHQRKRYTKEDR